MTHQEHKYKDTLFYTNPKIRVAVCPDHTRFLIQRCVGTRHGVARFEAFSCPTDITVSGDCSMRATASLWGK